MRPQETLAVGRVGIVFLIGVRVVVSVHCGPPERSTLHGREAD